MSSSNAAVQRLNVNEESGLGRDKSITFLKEFLLSFLTSLVRTFFSFWLLGQEPKFPLLLYPGRVIPVALAGADNF